VFRKKKDNRNQKNKTRHWAITK